MKQGAVAQHHFTQRVSFEYRLGTIVIPVTIAGEEFHFLLDTGAPNVISKELAQHLGLQSVATMKTTDSQKAKSDLEYVILDTVLIEGIAFTNTLAAVADLKQSNEIACLKIDGLIGANLMRHAIWSVDYEHQYLTISDSSHLPELDSSVRVIPFTPVLSGTPKMDIQLGSVTIENITVDTGSNGDLSLTNKHYEQLRKAHPEIQSVAGFGSSTSGLYGAGETDTIYTALVPAMQLGDLLLPNQFVHFKENGSNTFGTEYFKQYRVTFNWFNNTMSFDHPRVEPSTFRSFGFRYFYVDKKLIVNLLFDGSPATQAGLQIGDQILQMNGVDYSEITAEDWCTLIDSRELRELEELTLVVLRNGEEKTFQLHKVALIEHP